MNQAVETVETTEVVNPFKITKTISRLVQFGIPDETGKLVPIQFIGQFAFMSPREFTVLNTEELRKARRKFEGGEDEIEDNDVGANVDVNIARIVLKGWTQMKFKGLELPFSAQNLDQLLEVSPAAAVIVRTYQEVQQLGKQKASVNTRLGQR